MAVKTVVSIDLVRYSDHSTYLDDIAGPEVVAHFDDRIQGLVDQGLAAVGVARAGVVIRTTGDGALLAFDTPCDAHFFAAGVYAATDQHNFRKSLATTQLWFRIGAATGELHRAPGECETGLAAGAVIIRAVRLEASAQPGQLVIDQSTFDGLTNDLKITYSAEETVIGKRGEAFQARRRAFMPPPPAPSPAASSPASTRPGWHNVVFYAFLAVAIVCGGPVLLAALLGLSSRLTDVSLLGRCAIASIPFGGFLVVLNTWRTRQVIHLGRARQQEGINELTRRLLSRLYEPQLMTARSVRGLARGIEEHFGCAVLTDKIIIEAIRAAARHLEDRLSGRVLVEGLERLNALLLEIDADAIALLSLASIDRLNAYLPSQVYLMVPLFFALIVLGLGPPLFGLPIAPQVAYPLCALLLLAQAGFVVSNIRLASVWRRGPMAAVPPARAVIWLDVFWIMMTSRNRVLGWFLDCFWGPVWEGSKMMTTPGRFAVMHEFRYKVARDLWRRLRDVQDELDEIRPASGSEYDRLRAAFSSLCRDLWIVTGEKRFREIESRGQLNSDDLANRVIRHL